ncbi:EAL domain-containing protein [Nautilia lithotrophica]
MNEDLKKVGKTLSVLYVEDDEDSRNETAEIFKLYFKEVDTAVDGIEGLEKFVQNNYDILFTDISMPRMDGIKLIKEIRKVNEDIKCVVITAHSDIDFLLEVINLQVDGFILKPIQYKKLSDMLNKIIESIRAKQLIENYHKIIEKELDEKTKELALKYITDDITGLLNRHALNEELKFLKYDTSLILFDINDFSTINLVYSYEKGDKLLKYFADFLKHFVKENKIFRIEADKFTILTDKNKEEIINLSNQIIHELNRKYFTIENDKIYVDINIAIAYRTDNLFKKARLALEEIKLHKKNKINFYDDDLEIEKFKRKVNIIKPLIVEALKNDLIIPFFQPIIDNKTREIAKFEVLSRIKLSDKLIYPNDFIPIAEHTNLIGKITRIMIEKTFKIASENDFIFSINISEKDLADEYFIDFLKDTLNKYKIDPQRITFEVLENISSREIEHSILKLRELKNLGFKLSLDDFGTQSSNFEKILLLNLDYVKIDGKFVKNIVEDEKSKKIIKIIKKLANSINAKTIAEYVENEAIFNILNEMNIEYSQGYYFSKPVDNVNKFIKRI